MRLFHWSLVAMLCLSWWTGEQHEMEWHRRSGYAILGLLVFRIWWGFTGSRTARFRTFVKGPRAVVGYARRLFAAPYAPSPGHNPLGGWSVIVMLVVLTVMVVSGLFAIDIDGLESGPLSDLLDFDNGRRAAAVHHLIFDAILVLSALHIGAIFFYLVFKRHNLIASMIHGRHLSSDHEAEPLRASPKAIAAGVILALLAVSAASGLLNL